MSTIVLGDRTVGYQVPPPSAERRREPTVAVAAAVRRRRGVAAGRARESALGGGGDATEERRRGDDVPVVGRRRRTPGHLFVEVRRAFDRRVRCRSTRPSVMQKFAATAAERRRRFVEAVDPGRIQQAVGSLRRRIHRRLPGRR